MPRLVQVMAGRLYDAAFEAGRKEGYRQGVDATIIKQEEVHRAIYNQGAKDANHYGSAAFTAAACDVMHELFGFGTLRLKRMVDGIGERLINMIDPGEVIRRVRALGIHIEYDDMLTGEISDVEGWDL